ncbi:MAG: DUF3047 domain-containing protein [bacterium]|nr:DUF3047 domain-containing protein [bacterium]
MIRFSLILFLLFSPLVFAKEKSPQGLIEDFSKGMVGKLPVRFRTYPFQRGKAEKVYQIRKEGENGYLQAVDNRDLSVAIFREFSWDLKKYPMISWKWRAQVLPEEGDERFGPNQKNDSACGVYVIFGKYSGRALKYVWSTLAPVGTVVHKKENLFIFVKNSGTSEKGSWQDVHVNVLEDYKKVFGQEPSNPTGIGFLTDGNATHTPAACDYDTFILESPHAS